MVGMRLMGILNNLISVKYLEECLSFLLLYIIMF